MSDDRYGPRSVKEDKYGYHGARSMYGLSLSSINGAELIDDEFGITPASLEHLLQSYREDGHSLLVIGKPAILNHENPPRAKYKGCFFLEAQVLDFNGKLDDDSRCVVLGPTSSNNIKGIPNAITLPFDLLYDIFLKETLVSSGDVKRDYGTSKRIFVFDRPKNGLVPGFVPQKSHRKEVQRYKIIAKNPAQAFFEAKCNYGKPLILTDIKRIKTGAQFIVGGEDIKDFESDSDFD